MKYNRLLIAFAVFLLLGVSCKKDHYDVKNVHGIDAEGEVLLPLAYKSFTMMDMMKRFEIDSLIECTEEGNMSFELQYDMDGVLLGDALLRFDDLDYDGHFAFDNPFSDFQIPSFDTVLTFTDTLEFESEVLSVFEAEMKSGRFDFILETNMGNVQRVVIKSPNIFDMMGNEFEYETEMHGNAFGFDIQGLRYSTEEPNNLRFTYELYCNISGTSDPELYTDIKIRAHDLAFREIQGYVICYNSYFGIDTVFSLFPGNLSGMLELDNFRLKFNARNTFPLSACLVVDTALFFSEGLEPYTFLEPLPLWIDMPPKMPYGEVFNQTFTGRIGASGGRILSSIAFAVNPYSVMEVVSVDESCLLDVGIGIEIPIAFRLDDVVYLDTIDMNLSDVEFPEMIEKLTLNLNFNSTLPLSLEGGFYVYDSNTEQIIDTLLAEDQLIAASFDGKPVMTTLNLEVTEKRLQNVLRSNQIIMRYHLDTDAQNVVLKAGQQLQLNAKAKVKYNGSVEL